MAALATDSAQHAVKIGVVGASGCRFVQVLLYEQAMPAMMFAGGITCLYLINDQTGVRRECRRCYRPFWCWGNCVERIRLRRKSAFVSSAVYHRSGSYLQQQGMEHLV